MATPTRIVIVGASLAGAKAAEALREEGYDGALALVGAESERPYERPPLSKAYLRGESDREAARVHPEGWYREQEVELRRDAEVSAVDVGARTATVGGERLEWDRPG
jgi:3-phenylpropionate/trans-cinnamate dioxygenase ferredoxin reductase component